MEKEKVDKQEAEDVFDAGFSESQSALDVEVRAGEWQNLRKFKAFKHRSRQGKIIATYQAVSNRLNQLVGMYYKLVGKDPQQGEKMLRELRKLRMYQEILLNCL